MPRAFFTALLTFVLASCGDATGLLIEVRSSDLTAPDDIDALRFIVTSNAGAMVDETHPIRGAWPHSLTIAPRDGRDRDVVIQLVALKGGLRVLQREVHATFARGTTTRVEIVLDRACLGVMCDPGEDCVNAMCVDPGRQDAGPITMDAGPVDAAVRDGGPPGDAGEVDGAVADGGMDGGLDGGRFDAGPDGGPPFDGGVDAGLLDGGVDAGWDSGSFVFQCEDASCRGLIVISELRTGPSESATDEFVEIYNRSGVPVNVDGLELFYRSESGATGSRSTVSGETIILPGRYLLFASVAYAGPVDVPDRWATSSGLANGGGTVYIQAGSDIIDLVGWGGADPGVPGSETAPFTPGANACAVSCERKANASSTQASMTSGADALAGNGYDSEDNSTDFVQRATADPQTSASPREP